MRKRLNDLIPEHASGSGEPRVADHNTIRLVFSPLGAPRSRLYTDTRVISETTATRDTRRSPAADPLSRAIRRRDLYRPLPRRSVLVATASVARGLFPRFNKSPQCDKPRSAFCSKRHFVWRRNAPSFRPNGESGKKKEAAAENFRARKLRSSTLLDAAPPAAPVTLTNMLSGETQIVGVIAREEKWPVTRRRVK